MPVDLPERYFCDSQQRLCRWTCRVSDRRNYHKLCRNRQSSSQRECQHQLRRARRTHIGRCYQHKSPNIELLCRCLSRTFSRRCRRLGWSNRHADRDKSLHRKRSSPVQQQSGGGSRNFQIGRSLYLGRRGRQLGNRETRQFGYGQLVQPHYRREPFSLGLFIQQFGR